MNGMRMPAVVAWVFFLPGVLFIVVDIVRLNITGLFLVGVVFLILWAWLFGVFTREFWVSDDPRLGAVDRELREQEGRR